MDKKNTIIGLLLLVAAFAFMYLGRPRTKPPTLPEMTPPAGSAPAGQSQSPPSTTSAPTPEVLPPRPPPVLAPSTSTFAAIAQDNHGARITRIANDFIEVRLTDFGGAIRDVAFKQYPAEPGGSESYIFNQPHADPMLAFAEESFPGLGRDASYELVSATSAEAVYRIVFEDRLEITRRYSLPAADGAEGGPYRVRHETTIRNLTDQTAPLPRAVLSLGTTSLLSPNDYGQYLNVAQYDGGDTHYTDRSDLEGGGFLSLIGLKNRAPKSFIEKTGSVVWAAVKNQFFAGIYAPDQPGVAVITRRIELPPFPGASQPNIGVTGAARFELPPLGSGGAATLAGDLYVGPKEYGRLTRLPDKQDRVMQYDRYFFNRMFLSGYVAPLMNTLMNLTHRWVNNWGIAIILMTLILKFVTLPFTLAASRSAKRMQKFQPELQAIREKHKENPKKMQEETMRVFKEHKINPMGGCLPILITIPLFVGFFAMLQGTAELRFQSFLWTKDLSAPDTVTRIFGLPLNVMPLLMGATMIIQMRITPQPTVDNMQAKMFKLMPWIFTLICYNFSAALALYSTINGAFTIGQQLIVNRMRDPATDAPAASGKASLPAPKNATPSRKKGKR